MGEPATVLISVREGHLQRLSEIEEELRAAGLTIEGSMPRIGTITGSVDPIKIKKLNKIRGIEAVERSTAVVKA